MFTRCDNILFSFTNSALESHLVIDEKYLQNKNWRSEQEAPRIIRIRITPESTKGTQRMLQGMCASWNAITLIYFIYYTVSYGVLHEWKVRGYFIKKLWSKDIAKNKKETLLHPEMLLRVNIVKNELRNFSERQRLEMIHRLCCEILHAPFIPFQ
jgi:hypothetical protein